jgi:hypothetical protein
MLGTALVFEDITQVWFASFIFDFCRHPQESACATASGFVVKIKSRWKPKYSCGCLENGLDTTSSTLSFMHYNAMPKRRRRLKPVAHLLRPFLSHHPGKPFMTPGIGHRHEQISSFT